jgi:hypothetical protein
MPRTQRAHVCLLQRRYSKRLESLLKLRQPKECRHEHDRQPVPCSEPDQHALWSFLERHRCFFSEPMIRLSPDGACHVCAMLQQSNNILPVLPLCVFVTKATS